MPSPLPQLLICAEKPQSSAKFAPSMPQLPLFIGQNPKWRAPDVLDLERPDDQIDSFETSLGGPIARNKAWFFASYGRLSDNRIDTLRDGTIANLSREAKPLIAKVNFQPSDNQQIALTAIDSPSVAVGLSGNPGDKFAIMSFPLNGRVQTFSNLTSIITESAAAVTTTACPVASRRRSTSGCSSRRT